ncbi:MAG: hypothetical protein HY757_01070 [Nitrospirae bacterium]|nr:hypothetical protein [Nitrospirota bacterium]
MKVCVNKVSLTPLYCYLIGAVLFAMLISMASDAGALTTGETYSITAQKVNSNGSLAAVSASSSAVADSNGKISFSLTNVPDNGSCNFLVITVRDSTDTVVRRSIAPCPNSGESLPMGVSGLTNSQTDALLAALTSAGTDDPILAVFGFALVRSTAVTSPELSFMANLCNQGINNSGGFISYLTSNGVSSAQIASYRSYIIDRLANTASGYSKMIKDSVDASTAAAKLNARGEAASKLLLVLVQAATDAGFSQDRILEAFNAMGSIIMPLMQQGITNGDITPATAQMINSSIGGSIQKLKADKNIEKYSRALIALGASGADVTNYQTAANTLLNSMITAFKTFEQVFNGSETNTTISNAETVLNTAMQTAFNQFMTDTAASNSRITTMISNMDSALGVSTGLTVSDFQFYKPDGTTVNWPLTMVILVDWASGIVSNGGGMTYTRDSTAIPSNNLWLGSCSNSIYFNKTDCESNGGTWTAARTDFVGQGIPASYAAIFGIQQDIEILEFVRWAAQQAAGQNMSAHEALEKSYSNSVAGLASNISGTVDGSTSISSALKSAIVTLMKSPQF